jgi:hypothetical protein
VNFFLFVFETDTRFVSQDDLDLVILLPQFSSAGIIGVNYSESLAAYSVSLSQQWRATGRCILDIRGFAWPHLCGFERVETASTSLCFVGKAYWAEDQTHRTAARSLVSHTRAMGCLPTVGRFCSTLFIWLQASLCHFCHV